MDNCENNAAREYLREFRGILDRMIEGMTCAKLDCGISHNFIVQMIPHHRAAIEMSRALLEYSRCEPVRKIAGGIITEQTKSIEDMCAILDTCSERNPDGQLRKYTLCFREITDEMFSEMRNAPTDCCVSTDFMRQMIPHHRGAIRMSNNALQFPICAQLKPILSAIISSQTEGIREMERLLGNC